MQSIRGRIILLFVFCLIFGGVLTVLHYANMYSIKQKMIMMESFDNLLNNILELRRFEKNFTYYNDMDSLKSWNDYLEKIKESLKELDPDITRLAGADKYQRFKEDLKNYTAIMKSGAAMAKDGHYPIDVLGIRDKGKYLVEFAQDLIKIKQKNINNALNRIQILPVAYFSIFVLITIIVFQLVNFSILKPLYLIRSATKHVASDTFKPIVYNAKHTNEITKLISAFNKMAEELETRQEQLLHSRKLASIGTFTSGIAHELNNPLNNISLTAETLEMSGDEMNEEEKKGLLNEIVLQADRASQVVRNLLEFSRVEKPSMRTLEIKALLAQTLQFVKNQLMVKGIQLSEEIEDNLPPIQGKQQQLQNAMLNIIINSIQAMQDGGSIKIRAQRASNDRIQIDISDTGVGIDPSNMAHIFDPFYTTKEVGKGTGLGLSLVYGIIHAHGGYIEVNSKVNEGTTFSIFLPVSKEDAIWKEG